MKRKIKIFAVFVTFLIVLVGCKDSEVTDPINDQTQEIKIGALVSLTGNWSNLGITSKAALEAAVEEINQKFLQEGKNLKFVLEIVDTKLDPEIAYSKTQQLISEGVKIIIGPQSSSELSRIKSLADANDLLIISMGSTAGDLAIAGDHILRFCPDDKPEGLAIAKLMWERGIRQVIAVYRNDDGNIGLKRSMTSSFTNIGGSVIDSIKYSNDDNITVELINQISAAIGNATNPNEVGVYLAGFDEVTNIFELSSGNETLSSKLWFGSNGSASSSILISNTTAASFANSVEFCSPLFALSAENENEWNQLFSMIEQSTQIKPDAYTFAAYDAIKVAALAYSSVSENIQFSSLAAAYFNFANNYNGLTGITELNEAGDRKYGNFTLLGVCGSNSTFEWSSVGSYDTSTDVLVYSGCN